MHNPEEFTNYQNNLIKAAYAGMNKYAVAGLPDMDKKTQFMHLTSLLKATSLMDVRYNQEMLKTLEQIADREEIEVDGVAGFAGLARFADDKMHEVLIAKDELMRQIEMVRTYLDSVGEHELNVVAQDKNDENKVAKAYRWLEKYFMDALSQTVPAAEFQGEMCQVFVTANEDFQEIIGVALGDIMGG